MTNLEQIRAVSALEGFKAQYRSLFEKMKITMSDSEIEAMAQDEVDFCDNTFGVGQWSLN